MIGNPGTAFPWNYFREFIAPGADRFAILKKIMEEGALDHSVLTVSENRHFLVTAPEPEKDPLTASRKTILVAHYDRFPGSPGANDNSAAVFILAETAIKLMKEKVNNWLIIFTDKEELREGEGIQDQGAYSLAAGFKDSSYETARFYNFDACGTGDTLIISTTAEYLLKNENAGGNEKIRSRIRELRDRALEIARDLQLPRVLLLPTPFSDDAGFLRAGFGAQTITMLPSEECSSLVSILRKDPRFAEALVNHEQRAVHSKQLIPETWRCMNSPSDSHLRLTPKHFNTVLRFAEALCKY